MKFLLLLILFTTSLAFAQKQNDQLLKVKKADQPLKIDGIANDPCWLTAEWHPLDQLWLGRPYSEEDFSGRFKLAWTHTHLLLLVEIQDDKLFDQHEDPLKLWWDDDCVEVFVDEDNSGGEHQYNHNAFAYHIALDYNVVDMGPDKKGHLYNDHIDVKRSTEGSTTVWEMAITLYADTYKEESKTNKPVALFSGKKIGFALAYCDNDGSKERENFIGSVFVPGEDKNKGWIDANVFGTIELVE
ncbi:hypothetical protein C900_01365 [Fulvivirga imtechensis AK7]|uniref:Carbohydrate-binding domain-containing protein n=1 Tax=Fulvivirga imtechensis AK7 TaxID=1237149 RepID=L8JYC2_9BACT|nr:sugar-binding protein [Fulvivirga imtechensis]ELR73755.1 hypothetical protein C900_01365 [Fulvivirga imtechensis AK7]